MRDNIFQSRRKTGESLTSRILPACLIASGLMFTPIAGAQAPSTPSADATTPSTSANPTSAETSSTSLAENAGGNKNCLTNVNDIADRVAASDAQRQAMLQHYESDRTYHLDYNGIGGEHIADLMVRAVYNAPGTKHFTVISETGSKGFGDKVLRRLVESEEEASQSDNRRRMAFTTENFEMHLVGRDVVDGIQAYVLDVKPRNANRFAYSGRVWISMKDFAIIRVDGSPVQMPAWMISHIGFNTQYIRDGDFWLPRRNQTITHLVMGGEVKITIDYGPYEDVVASPAKVNLASIAPEK